jgi:hypothetical protein
MYTSTIQDLENKLFSLHPKAKEIYALINGLKTFSFDEANPPAVFQPVHKLVFDKNAPVVKKILFALKYLNSPVKVGEIEKAIKEFEPDFDKGFSTPLRILREDKLIDTYNPTGSNRDAYYGLKEWFVEDGKLKAEYLAMLNDYVL